MRDAHPVEALLRPAVEYDVGLAHVGLASFALVANDFLLMTPSVGIGTGLALGGSGAYWFYEGWQLRRYQRNLSSLPLFELANIPAANDQIYIGKGFEWEEKHTQRLHDSRRSKLKKYAKPKRIRNYWKKTPPGGGNPCLHGVELNERVITVPTADGRGHTIVFGTTGVGKTRLLELMVSQSIERGGPVVVIDPKGDADLLTEMFNMSKEQGREFVMFHLGYDEVSARYNSLANFDRVTEVAGRLAEELSDEGQSAVFKEFAWRFVNVVARALTALGHTPNYELIYKHVNAIDELFVHYCDYYFSTDEEMLLLVEQELKKIDMNNLPSNMVGRTGRLIAWDAALMEQSNGDIIITALRGAYKYERQYFDKIIASLIPLLDKLTTGSISALLSPDYLDMKDNRPILDWKEVIRKNQVVYVGLDALSDATVASAVGGAMLADLVSVAGSRYKFGDTRGESPGAQSEQKPLNLYLDEFNEIVSAKNIISMVNKGGGAGMHLTAFTQTYSDIEAKIGTAAKARQIRGNFNTMIMLRVQDKETATILTDQLPTVSVHDLTLISGYTDSSNPESSVDFVSNHQDRLNSVTVPMLDPSDVMKLPKGQAFGLINGGEIYKIRMPLKKKTRHADFSKSFEQMTEDMREKYRSGLDWAQAT